MPSYPWCEHLQFSYGNMRSCNDGCHLYGGYAQYVYLETSGRGAEIVVECVGRPEVFPEGLKYLRKAGMYLEPGNFVDCGEASMTRESMKVVIDSWME